MGLLIFSIILSITSLSVSLLFRLQYLTLQATLKGERANYDSLSAMYKEVWELANITKSSLLEVMAGYNQAVIFADRATGIVKYKRVFNNLEEVYYHVMMEKADLALKDSWKTLWSSDEFINREQAKLAVSKQRLLAELARVDQENAKLLNAASTIELDDYLNKG